MLFFIAVAMVLQKFKSLTLLTLFHWDLCLDVSATFPCISLWLHPRSLMPAKAQAHWQRPNGDLFGCVILIDGPFLKHFKSGKFKNIAPGSKWDLVTLPVIQKLRFPSWLALTSSGQIVVLPRVCFLEKWRMYQLFKRRFRDVSNGRMKENTFLVPQWFQDEGNRTDFYVKMSIDTLQWNAKSRWMLRWNSRFCWQEFEEPWLLLSVLPRPTANFP